MKKLILFLSIILIPMVAVAVISIGIPSVQVKKVDTNSYVEPEPISEIKQKKRKPINEVMIVTGQADICVIFDGKIDEINKPYQ